MITTAKIAEEMKQPHSPSELANYKVYLAADYAYLAGQLTNVLDAKPKLWMLLREDSTSDTQAERKWGRTEDGMKETSLRLQLKSIEKLMSAISTKISVAQGEAKAQY